VSKRRAAAPTPTAFPGSVHSFTYKYSIVKLHYNYKYEFLRPKTEEVVKRYKEKWPGGKSTEVSVAVRAAAAASAAAANPTDAEPESPEGEAAVPAPAAPAAPAAPDADTA